MPQYPPMQPPPVSSVSPFNSLNLKQWLFLENEQQPHAGPLVFHSTCFWRVSSCKTFNYLSDDDSYYHRTQSELMFCFSGKRHATTSGFFQQLLSVQSAQQVITGTSRFLMETQQVSNQLLYLRSARFIEAFFKLFISFKSHFKQNTESKVIKQSFEFDYVVSNQPWTQLLGSHSSDLRWTRSKETASSR